MKKLLIPGFLLFCSTQLSAQTLPFYNDSGYRNETSPECIKERVENGVGEEGAEAICEAAKNSDRAVRGSLATIWNTIPRDVKLWCITNIAAQRRQTYSNLLDCVKSHNSLPAPPMQNGGGLLRFF
jgi:hypothetical protein